MNGAGWKQTLKRVCAVCAMADGRLRPGQGDVYAQVPVDPGAAGGACLAVAGDGKGPGSAAQVAEIQRRINNSAVETAGMANFFSGYGDQEWVMLPPTGARMRWCWMR